MTVFSRNKVGSGERSGVTVTINHPPTYPTTHPPTHPPKDLPTQRPTHLLARSLARFLAFLLKRTPNSFDESGWRVRICTAQGSGGFVWWRMPPWVSFGNGALRLWIHDVESGQKGETAEFWIGSVGGHSRSRSVSVSQGLKISLEGGGSKVL